MPNWCMNSVTFGHEDPAEITRMKEAFLNDRLLSEFVPNPAGDNAEDWYSFNISNWGTKWDTGGSDISALETNSITLLFDTAWSPPIAFYEALVEDGWEVHGYYYEPGMNFCGRFDNGIDDYFEIPATSDEVIEEIPSDIDECFSISEQMADRESEEEYNEEDEE